MEIINLKELNFALSCWLLLAYGIPHISCELFTDHIRFMNAGCKNLLDRKTTKFMMHTYVTSRIDKGNSLLYGIACTFA